MTEASAEQEIEQWLTALEKGLDARDMSAVQSLFDDECFWRDLLPFTWNIKTMEGWAQIRQMLEACLDDARPCNWSYAGKATRDDGVCEGWLTLETDAARCKGYVRLRDGKCWTLLTAMAELKGYEEKAGPRREKGVEHGAIKNRKSWAERRAEADATLGITTQPYCLIIGGGQGGIALGARMKRIGVPALIIDKNERPGDAWRNRYKSLCLHDPVWYDHMPYIPFPDHWPVYSPKDKLGDWLEMYTKVMELNYWTRTQCRNAVYDDNTGEWSVEVERDGQSLTLQPKHLVLATGMSGVPNIPSLPGAESFQGEQHHSSRHLGPDAYAGKTCVIVGANNSAHDIAAALWEIGADVTMIQRSSTLVARSETLAEFGTRRLYSEEALERGIDTVSADYLHASVPYKVMPRIQARIYEKIVEHDKDFYDRLREAGFVLDFGEDNTGLHTKYLRRGAGYYIDVGASELVASGQIKLRSGVEPTALTEHSLILSDGTELEADLIVYATGYGSMNGWAAQIISQATADKVGKCWGLGSDTKYDPGPWEGELRNMWKPTQQEALWFHGGNLQQSRHYSLYVALQIKARMEGIPTPVYGMPPVHHLE